MLTPAYRERPVQFGPQRSLLGILCTPPTLPPASAPVAIMLNAGVLHRVGVSRIHVEMARRLAAAGLSSLRFDLSGIGDSLPRKEQVSLAAAVDKDIEDAMGFLHEGDYGNRFVLVGLCSGAYDALTRAERDERVVGVFAIDLIGSFVNTKHVLRHYLKRLLNAASWRNAFSGRNNAVATLRKRISRNGQGSTSLGVGVRKRLSKAELDTFLGQLLDRGVRLAFYFTDGLEENYNYRSQFRDNHPQAAASPLCTSVFVPGSNHSLTNVSHRELIISGFVRWMGGLGV